MAFGLTVAFVALAITAVAAAVGRSIDKSADGEPADERDRKYLEATKHR